MNVYKFVFAVGLLNVVIPFLGFPIVARQYAFVTIGIVALLYALYVRAIVKEQEAGLYQPVKKEVPATEPVAARTIEQVVEMHVPEKVVVSDVKPKRRGRRPKVAVHEEAYE